MKEQERREEREDEVAVFEMGSVSEQTAGFPGGADEGDEPLPI